MKTGIVTFFAENNYGAMLQAYALKQALINMGHDANMVDYQFKMRPHKYKLINTSGAVSFKHKITLTIRSLLKLPFFFGNKRTFNNYTKFMKEHLSPVPANVLNDYDAFVCGSDQIWNPRITGGVSKEYFGDFGVENAKRISYAASCGDVKELDSYKKEFAEKLLAMDSISVREEQLSEYIKKELGISAETVLDPSLLLSSEEYEKIIDRPRIINKPYILVYNMHSDNPQVSDVAKQLSNQLGIDIVEINTFEKKTFSHKNHIILASNGPLEFLNLIKYANAVVTNSFHGTAFSIIFKKDFYTTGSKRRERVNTLLKKTDLIDRYIEDNHDVSFSEIDYNKVYAKLNTEIEKSKQFLEKALSTGRI